MGHSPHFPETPRSHPPLALLFSTPCLACTLHLYSLTHFHRMGLVSGSSGHLSFLAATDSPLNPLSCPWLLFPVFSPPFAAQREECSCTGVHSFMAFLGSASLPSHPPVPATSLPSQGYSPRTHLSTRSKDTGQANQETAEELQEGRLRAEQWGQGEQQPWP